MTLLTTLRFIVRHPLNRTDRLAITRFLRWQVGSRLAPGSVVVPWVNGAQMLVHPGETGLTGNVYSGLHEYSIYGVRTPRPSPGRSSSMWAQTLAPTRFSPARRSGARGICFEPVPATFARLKQNVAINGLGERVQCLNVGVGERAGNVRSLTAGQDCMNHVIAADEYDGYVIEYR